MIRRNPAMDAPLPSKKNAILLIVHYFFGYMFLYPQLGIYMTFLISGQQGVIYTEIAYGIYTWMILGSLLLAKPYLKESMMASRGNFFKHVFKAIKLYFPLYLSLLVITPVIQFITKSETSQNQLIIEEAFGQSPLLIAITALIMAPIVEEIVFRGALYRSLRNCRSYWFAIAISILSFGFVHVLQSLLTGNYQDLYSIILYSAMGFFFVKAYEETGSIFPAIFLHLIVNSVGVLVIYLVAR